MSFPIKPRIRVVLVLLLMLLWVVDGCSFIASSFSFREVGVDTPYVNALNRRRGPDATNVFELPDQTRDWTFLHNLLRMTGERVLQPFISESSDIVAMFNGEIYNFKELGATMDKLPVSDGEVIIPTYIRSGRVMEFVQKFRGEFSLFLIDFSKRRLVLATDTFSTKPLWYGITNSSSLQHDMATRYPSPQPIFICASYESVLQRLGVADTDRQMVDPNTIMEFDIDSLNLVHTAQVFAFDTNQHKETTDDWITAFEEAVRIRTQGLLYMPFIGLSDGYDSGAIALALCRLRVPTFAFTIRAKEHMETIQTRLSHKVCRKWLSARFLTLSATEFSQEQAWLSAQVEKFVYTPELQDVGPRKEYHKFTKFPVRVIIESSTTASARVTTRFIGDPVGDMYVRYVFNKEAFSCPWHVLPLNKVGHAWIVLPQQIAPEFRNLRGKLFVQLVSLNADQQWIALAELDVAVQVGRPAQLSPQTNHKDFASVGLSYLLRQVKQLGGLVYISGSGADETISDYAIDGKPMFSHSNFNGTFPENLDDVFPWPSFYKGSQRSYLMKEETVGGAHGIETRYPFLDPYVVQEYLWLSAAAKNSIYKRPLHDYLRNNKFAFQRNRKTGFSPMGNLTDSPQVLDSTGNLNPAQVMEAVWQTKRTCVVDTYSGQRRDDCGFAGIDNITCAARGCCWDASPTLRRGEFQCYESRFAEPLVSQSFPHGRGKV